MGGGGGGGRLVIGEDDVCYKEFTGLYECGFFFGQLDAFFSDARTICEVDATNSG